MREDRRLFYNARVVNPSAKDRMQIASLSRANLFSSELQNGQHSPILDLDFDVKLVPSSTPGRYHLYMDGVVLDKNKYRKMIECLVEVGVLQPGILRQFNEKGGTFARPPWVSKPADDGGSN